MRNTEQPDLAAAQQNPATGSRQLDWRLQKAPYEMTTFVPAIAMVFPSVTPYFPKL